MKTKDGNMVVSPMSMFVRRDKIARKRLTNKPLHS